MPRPRRDRRSLVSALVLPATCAAAVVLGSSGAAAAPIKVACVGEQTTHSDQLSRSVEYPAMLQTLVGACYDVQNFGDCCATVLQGYPMQAETHPYLDPPARFAPAFHESVMFAPDVVVIGSWGKHDTEIESVLDGGKLDPIQWQADYEELVTTYLNLPSKPTVYVSTPLPLPMGAGTGPTTDVILPAIENIAAKYHLAIVPLYPAFLNRPQLYKDATHPTDTTGLKTIADTVYATMMATMGSCVDGGLLPPPSNGGAGADATAPGDGDAGSVAGSRGAGSGDAADTGSGSVLGDGAAPGGDSGGDRGAAATGGCACGVAGGFDGIARAVLSRDGRRVPGRKAAEAGLEVERLVSSARCGRGVTPATSHPLLSLCPRRAVALRKSWPVRAGRDRGGRSAPRRSARINPQPHSHRRNDGERQVGAAQGARGEPRPVPAASGASADDDRSIYSSTERHAFHSRPWCTVSDRRRGARAYISCLRRSGPTQKP